MTIAGGATPSAAQAPAGAVRISTSAYFPELVKRLPIGRRSGAKRRVVMSIAPDRLGDLEHGDRLDANAEFEVTVCLKHDPDAGGSGYPCVGKTYGYDPHVSARIVLAPRAGTTNPRRTVRISHAKTITCNQSQPNRNHHCVITLQHGDLDVRNVSGLPCRPARCHVNLVVTAYHQSARRGEVVVVGSNTRDGEIEQNRGRLDAIRYRPGEMELPHPRVSRVRREHRLPVAPEGHDPEQRSIYSVALPELTEGEQLVVDGTAIARIGGLPYNVFETAKMVLTGGPHAIEPNDAACRAVGCHERAEIGRPNGANCTHGPSPLSDPCTRRKIGVVRIVRTTHRTLYLNVVVGMAAQPNEFQHYHSGDRARIARGGYVRVYRFGP